MRFREGDLVEDVNGIIFDVKGLVHPPNRVVAFPRFIPHAEGERKRDSVRYSKVYALSVRYGFLKEKFSEYLVQDEVFGELLCEIPADNIKRHYCPTERLLELRSNKHPDPLEKLALELAETLKESANIPWNSIGVSGSILAKLHTQTSDIDPIIYGAKNCRKAYAALGALAEDKKSPLKPYCTRAALRKLFEFRSKDTRVSFEDFVRTESRKVLQGTYEGHDYFIRCVKDRRETRERYGDVHYTNVGYAKIKATVTDDSEAIFTPCTYKIEQTLTLEGTTPTGTISEIVSFRGRFNEHARNGETVIAQGKIERAQDKEGEEWLRLLLGNRPTDFMILA
jgi:predicted nucleotidyltransferase